MYNKSQNSIFNIVSQLQKREKEQIEKTLLLMFRQKIYIKLNVLYYTLNQESQCRFKIGSNFRYLQLKQKSFVPKIQPRRPVGDKLLFFLSYLSYLNGFLDRTIFWIICFNNSINTLNYIQYSKQTYFKRISKQQRVVRRHAKCDFYLRTLFIYIKLQMKESEKFNKIAAVLKQNQQLIELIKLINTLATKYPNFASEQFLNSVDKTLLTHQMQLLAIPQLQDLMNSIKIPHSIVALPLSEGSNKSLFFAIVPENHKLDWHSHPQMFGISKRLHGELQIRTLNKKYLNEYKPGKYIYSQSELEVYHVRTERAEQSTAVVVPRTDNIHRIEAKRQSAFLDLLMPDYPEDRCDFYELRGQKNQNLLFRSIEEPKEKILSWNDNFDQILLTQKQIVKNFIQKMKHNQ